MKLESFKNSLKGKENITFLLQDGQSIPLHFHITEIGQINKKFIDCGGTIREENKIGFQLWNSIDFDHRLKASKLINIINLSIDKLGIKNHEIEIEYQGDTIGKYGLEQEGENYILTRTRTDCLAKDNCGVPLENAKDNSETKENAPCCSPAGGCC